MQGLLNWLRRILGLPRLDGVTALFVFLLLFVFVPLLGPACEEAVEHLVPGADGYLWRAAIFALLAVGFAVVTGVVVRARQVFRVPGKGYRQPAPGVRHLVMLFSHRVPSAEACGEVQELRERFAAFQRVKALAHGEGPEAGAWRSVELVLRAAEWHWASLERLVLVVTQDGLGHPERGADLTRLQTLLEHYLSLRDPTEPLKSFRHAVVRSSVGFEATGGVVDEEQRQLEPEDAIFDFTMGTKPMSAGMVLACIDDSFDLQYFVQLHGAQREQAVALSAAATGDSSYRRDPGDPLAVAWGRVPLEATHDVPLEAAGLLPILVDTDARMVQARLGG